jgi:ABC-type multidrug transport system fused ATPase/permease subunit
MASSDESGLPADTASDPGLVDATSRLLSALPRRRRRQVAITFLLMVLGALAEVVSIGAILPFLAALTDPGRLASLPLMDGLLARIPAGTNIVRLFTLVFIAIVLISCSVRLVLTWASQRLPHAIAQDLSVISFGKMLRQPYRYYLDRHSSEVISTFQKLHNLTFTVLSAGIQALVATVIGTMIFVLLLFVNPVAAITAGALLGGLYLLISIVAQPVLRAASEAGSFHSGQRFRYLQESWSGIRNILLDRLQPAFEREYRESAEIYRRNLVRTAFLNAVPRIFVEALGLVIISLYAWYLSGRPGGITAAIPMLGALALGAQRLLPLAQQAFVGWSAFVGNYRDLVQVAQLVTLEEDSAALPASPARPFRSIAFEAVGFGYRSDQSILKDIAFSICRGDRVGIVGTTGSGKSTLVDLLLGLLPPTEGAILLNGEPITPAERAAWQVQVAHVPQAIHIADDTLEANIAFGVAPGERDAKRVIEAARAADIHAFIAALPDGYATRAGERGVRLSGGQRQRIGIARALYKQAEVLILDEATSALDSRTETEVMRSVTALAPDLTIIIIAHRTTTLSGCNKLLRVEGGRLRAIGSEELA